MQPDAEQIRQALRVFAPLRDAPGDCLARLQGQTQLIRIAAGARLFDERASCPAFPLVLKGAIRVSKLTPQGREIMLYRVAPGESCVLTSACLLGDANYAATGIAESDVTLIAIPRALFDMLIAQHAPFLRHVFELFATRLSELMLLIEEVAFRRLDQRLAALLCTRGPLLRVTHQALADELGSVREIASRLLGNFADRGWVRLGREQIEVLAPDALRTYSVSER